MSTPSNQQQPLAGFPADFLERPDAEVGQLLLQLWTAFQLERRGVLNFSMKMGLAKDCVKATQSLETDNIDNMPLTKAMNLASRGELARAGRMLKELITKGAHEIVLQRRAELGSKIRSQRRQYSKQGNAAKKKRAAEKHATWIEIGKILREQHPAKSDKWLAAEIARKTGDKAATIRAALADLGLSINTASHVRTRG
jgi:hypothetical protein